MAQQESSFPLKGRIGKLTFFKSGNNYMARAKTGVDRKKILNGERYDNTRRSMAEFGRAGQASKIVRLAFVGLVKKAADRHSVSRLTRAMMDVIKSDPKNDKGDRNILDGNVELLTGFEFNQNAELGTTVYAPFTTKVDRDAGELTISFASFIPSSKISAPKGATHFRIVSGGAEIDFEKTEQVATLKETDPIALDDNPTNEIDLTHTVTAKSMNPLFLVLGIQFLSVTNGFVRPVQDMGFNALRIAEASRS
jgi:hypothetical protein